MNAIVLRALFEDAFQQVLDNKIFRVLLVIAFLMVAPSFVVGLREDHITVLFGWYEMSYESVLAAFSGGGGGVAGMKITDAQSSTIQGVQGLIVDTLCGSIGMIFCIAATSIFVPRLLERGYADTLFSKPVARWKIFLTQYVSGLLFVTMLAVVLVGGIYMGLLLVSGYNDPGFLWSIFTLAYLFALLHSVSMLIGVVTRSTVAAILLTTILFMLSGCVHSVWQVQQLRGTTPTVSLDGSTDGAAKDAEADEPPPTERRAPPFAVLRAAFTVLHYVLPKTSDADQIARMFRRATQRDLGGIEDIGQTFSVRSEPPSFSLQRPPGAGKRAGLTQIDLSEQPATWIEMENGEERARIEIRRRTRVIDAPADGEASKRKPKKQGTKAAADELFARLKTEGAAPTTRQVLVDRSFAQVVAWHDDARGVEREVAFFSLNDWMYETSLTQRKYDATDDKRAHLFDAFLDDFSLSGSRESNPYAARFGWTSELKYNAFFSLGSSLLFAALMLALGIWKLARIDF